MAVKISFRFTEKEDLEDLAHFFVGLILVFSCNFMVIIGIIADVCFLLIPWLMCYGVGKITDFLTIFYFSFVRWCLSHHHHFPSNIQKTNF